MKRSSVNRPPWRGGGGPRNSGSSEGGAAIGSVAPSMPVRIIGAAIRIGRTAPRHHNCTCNDQDCPHRRRSPELPGIDGIEVARRLSKNGSGPAIVLTSSRDLADLGLVRERSPVRGFIPKAELSGAALEALL